jgi:hypothetical protein
VPWRFSAAGRLTAWIGLHPGGRKPAQKQTKKAATFDAVWRFSEHHTDPYVSGSDMKNVVWDRWPHHDETSKEKAYCGSGGFKKNETDRSIRRKPISVILRS